MGTQSPRSLSVNLNAAKLAAKLAAKQPAGLRLDEKEMLGGHFASPANISCCNTLCLE